MRYFLDDKENMYELLGGVNSHAPKAENEHAKACIMAYLGYYPMWTGAAWTLDNRVLRTAFITKSKQAGVPDFPVAAVLQMPPTLKNACALIVLFLVPRPIHNNTSRIIEITKAYHGVDISPEDVYVAMRA